MARVEREIGGIRSVHSNCLSSNWDAPEQLIEGNAPQTLASDCDYVPKCWDGDSVSNIRKSTFVPTPAIGGEVLSPMLVVEQLPYQAAPTTDDSIRSVIAQNIKAYSSPSSRNINVKLL